MQTSNRASSHADGQEADACHLIARQELGLWSVLMPLANGHSVLGMSGGPPRLRAGLGLADGLGITGRAPHRGEQPVTEGAHAGSGLGGGQAAVDGECASKAGQLGDSVTSSLRSLCSGRSVMPPS